MVAKRGCLPHGQLRTSSTSATSRRSRVAAHATRAWFGAGLAADADPVFRTRAHSAAGCTSPADCDVFVDCNVSSPTWGITCSSTQTTCGGACAPSADGCERAAGLRSVRAAGGGGLQLWPVHGATTSTLACAQRSYFYFGLDTARLLRPVGHRGLRAGPLHLLSGYVGSLPIT